MTEEEYYGAALPRLRQAEQCLLNILRECPMEESVGCVQPMIACRISIKKPESRRNKLRSLAFPLTPTQHHRSCGCRVGAFFI
ncbi:MAG: hypothetical protein LIO95_04480 [Clostridiales bacterium]|nr:hypothetical protein [Clostridiales bacterium]